MQSKGIPALNGAMRLESEGARLRALPNAFGGYFLIVESAVYDQMRRLCPSYAGGYWEYFEIDCGGFFMAPRPLEHEVEVESPNGCETMSNMAAGMVACLYAIGALCARYEAELLAERYHELLDQLRVKPRRSGRGRIARKS